MNRSILTLDPNAPLQAWPVFPESEISSGARTSNGHLWFVDKLTGISIGVWESEANLGRWMNWPVHEFMIVVEGEVVVVEENRETVVGPGECFLIPKGRRCIWNQPGYLKKLLVFFDDLSGLTSAGLQPIVKVNPNVSLSPCLPPAAEFLHSPIPIQQVHEYFKDVTGQFEVGVWETTDCHGKVVNSPCHELMHLLEGEVTFSDEKGRIQKFSAGDTFFVPMGTPNSWKSEGLVRKIYCILEPHNQIA